MNNVSLISRLTRPNSDTLKVDHQNKLHRSKQSVHQSIGEREADFINCVAWGKLAETIAHNLSKDAE